MDLNLIKDWDDAYSNGSYIDNASAYPARWLEAATQYRQSVACELDVAYGQSEREVMDIFLPTGKPVGLFVFVHGGYWVRFDKSYWSHLAKGFVDAGWAVAMPSYQLCPDVSIATIETQVAAAIEVAASRVDGRIILGGHSAGGQLVTSMVCENTVLSNSAVERVAHVLSISGVHDLRPLLNADLNEKLKLNMSSACNVSPALKTPVAGTKLTALVGIDERPEFVRQNALLANIWLGVGASTCCVEAPAKHHFNIIDLLAHESTLIKDIISSTN